MTKRCQHARATCQCGSRNWSQDSHAVLSTSVPQHTPTSCPLSSLPPHLFIPHTPLPPTNCAPPTFHHACLVLRLVACKHDVWTLLHHEGIIVCKGVACEGVGGCRGQVTPCQCLGQQVKPAGQTSQRIECELAAGTHDITGAVQVHLHNSRH
jgi:hypothetical protein